MAYQLEGEMLEVCTCKVLCPCWIGEDADGGSCVGTIGYHFSRGTIDGVDVSGLSLVALTIQTVNVLRGNWRVILYLDDRASPEQTDALLAVFSGKLGGPVADLAALIGDVVALERVPITFEADRGQGRLRVGRAVSADLAPFQGATGRTTALYESMFSTIPESPIYVGKASSYRVDAPQLELEFDISGHNAMQGPFRFVA